MNDNTSLSVPGNWKIPFFTIWTGQAFSILGSALVQFALIWWLTQTTGSATVLATASLVGFLPVIFLGPFAGALIDRWNRRLVMIAADSLIALATLGLIVLFWTGIIQPWHVYAILFVRSLGSSFHWPAMQASTSLMVPREHLSRIAGGNQALQGGLNILAPPLGAVLLGLLPMYAVLSIDILTALLAVLPLLFVRIPQPERVKATGLSPVGAFWSDFKAGLRYVVSWPGLLIIALMATLVNFMVNPPFALMPLLVTEHFGGGIFQVGWMDSAVGIGAVLGGVILGVWGGFRRRIFTTLLGLSGMGVGIILIGLAPSDAYWLGLAGVALTGFMMPITNGPLHAIVQSTVAPEMQGRVMTLINSLASAMTPLSMAVAGPLSDRLGISFWYILGGISCLLMAVGSFLIPAVLRVEEGRNQAPAAVGIDAEEVLSVTL